jgi:acetylornithine deacetylase/succinyl-diaminopimelate desuccinylase-like protein
MVSIPSVYGEEEKVALLIASKIREYGLEVTLDEVFPGRRTEGYCQGKTARRRRSSLEKLIEKLRNEDPDLLAEVKIFYEPPPMEIREDQVIVRALREAVLEVHNYTNNAGILVNNANIPTVIFGLGDIREAHQPNESIPVGEMTTATKIYGLTAPRLLS